MEGYPLTEFSDYDNVTGTSTYSLMESMGNVKGISWLPIITMKEELINHMKDDFTNDIKL